MKAFLSHSSHDKGYVDAVAATLRPGTFELDSQTFDLGKINSQAILSALDQCNLFCLFLSGRSVNSDYVNFETLLGIEFLASGRVSTFLAICLDETAFQLASSGAKHFNIVRNIPLPDTAARLIEGQLISLQTATHHHVFIGREDELKLLGGQITDHSRPPQKALYLSGNYGSGRRTIARKVLRDYFPHVNHVIPLVRIEPFAGLDELYRTIVGTIRPNIRAVELQKLVRDFEAAPAEKRPLLLASELNSLLPMREAVFVFDNGGLLTDSGSLVPELNDILDHLSSTPHPPIIFISPRMGPKRLRRPDDDISYLAVKSLGREATIRIISALLRAQELTVGEDELEQLFDLSDSHPFNIYRMIDEIVDSGPLTFLANPSAFVDWKHRQSSEYIGRIELAELDIRLLTILKLVPQLDFAAIVNAIDTDSSQVSTALMHLVHHHVIENIDDRFMIAPPIRVAVERDSRIQLSGHDRRAVIRRLASSLSMRLEEGSAPVMLIDAAIYANLQDGDHMPQLVSAFLLPSHYVWMANTNYHARRWQECIRYAKKALERVDRLSSSGIVGACRFLCLAASRLRDQLSFSHAIKTLRSLASDDWIKNNIAFLEGFNCRLKGELPKAEKLFRQAYRYSPGNFSVARELAAVCLARGNLNESERFAREAHQHAPHNPYLVDILVSVLIRKYQDNKDRSRIEIEEMFDLLAQIGEEGGKSFYTTRRAEFEHLCGDNAEAMKLIDEAVRRTPGLFEPLRLQAEILLTPIIHE